MQSTSPLLLSLALGLLLAGCGGGAATDPAGEGGVDRLELATGFYPLQYAAERVGGDRVTVRSLAGSGVEPHDLELTPKDLGQLGEADLLVHLRGFQPAVDEAVDQTDVAAYDVAEGADLMAAPGAAGSVADDGHGHGDEEAAETAPEGGESAPAVASTDPHFWLDPIRLADVGAQIAERLAQLDPGSAELYRANAADLRTDLETLDDTFQSELANCSSRALVTGHEAFGYLAAEYGFEQIGIAGLSPQAEPTPATMARIAGYVRDNSVATIYSETRIDPAIARAVAAESGAKVAMLDPLESQLDSGADYLDRMRTNLDTLRSGQECD